mgnify:CR=1 FL=1
MSGYRRSARLSGVTQRGDGKGRDQSVCIIGDHGIADGDDGCGCRHGRRGGELANGTGGGFARCLVAGTIRPVDRGKEIDPADKQQERQDTGRFGKTLDHILRMGTSMHSATAGQRCQEPCRQKARFGCATIFCLSCQLELG